MSENQQIQKIKCVVWDLDNTLWSGTLLEDDKIVINDSFVNIIKDLDKRGILNSIASRNDFESAKLRLDNLGLWHYFIYPEIGWQDKSLSIKRIAENINIGMDSIAFVDDQIFEREEVKYVFSMVRTYSPQEIIAAVQEEIFMPKFLTNESALRRIYYQNEITRKKAQENFEGSNIEFLKTLGLIFTVKPATQDDLQRAEELTVRTHQLNTSGISYSYLELYDFMNSNKHILYICSLEDKFGSYGTIGLALIEVFTDRWRIKLMLMSCRVISRNVGNVLIAILNRHAKLNNRKMQVEFVHNDKNRQMYMTYKFAGFNEVENNGNYSLLELEPNRHLEIPSYVKIEDYMSKNEEKGVDYATV